jgi:hypothetical protein
MKITQYVTAYGNNPRELDQSVNALLAKGFQPHGNPYATENPVEGAMESQLLAQAMVKSDSIPGQP